MLVELFIVTHITPSVGCLFFFRALQFMEKFCDCTIGRFLLSIPLRLFRLTEVGKWKTGNQTLPQLNQNYTRLRDCRKNIVACKHKCPRFRTSYSFCSISHKHPLSFVQKPLKKKFFHLTTILFFILCFS